MKCNGVRADFDDTCAFVEQSPSEFAELPRGYLKYSAWGRNLMYFFFSVDLDAENHVLQIGTQIEGEIARVNVDRLDNTLGGIKTSMIKINVEGLETEVIRGKDLTFKSLSVMVVLIELNRSVQ